ncbi:hypothetical protein B0T21DRAFT_352795 [Apiosordaria backusii]|uniref:Uncharacterized protein n=1 Tax=Apiosordaria backusii TaxID=314023 RepID=A0AA40A3T0_9PEZI|nr:hypothetical protein B0T21DRAFT_352795 [Apiosordaria backusii]
MRPLAPLLLTLVATVLASSDKESCKYDCFCHTDQSPLCCGDVGGAVDESGHCTKMSFEVAQEFVRCCDTSYSCRQGMGCPELDGGDDEVEGGRRGKVELR